MKRKSRRAKEGRTKAKTRKVKRMAVNIDNILASISSSYETSDVVEDLDLSKIRLLNLRQVRWIKCLLESGKLPGNIRSTFLQNLKPAVKKALAQVSDSEEEDSTQEGKESSNEEDVADENSSDQDKGDEQSIGEVEEKEEVMTVEQAKLVEQYSISF